MFFTCYTSDIAIASAYIAPCEGQSYDIFLVIFAFIDINFV